MKSSDIQVVRLHLLLAVFPGIFLLVVLILICFLFLRRGQEENTMDETHMSKDGM